jgi:hypothetical protein
LSDADIELLEPVNVPKLLFAFVAYKLPNPSSFIIGFILLLSVTSVSVSKKLPGFIFSP